jgi:hypothetical protein
MGNCVGKNSTIHHNQHRHSPSTILTSTKLYCNDQRPTKPTPSLLLALPSSSPLNTSSERSNIFLSRLSDVKETDIIFNDNDETERKVIQYSSLSLLATTPSKTNDQLVFMHTPSTLSPVQLSSECKKSKSSNTVKVFSENHIKQPFTLTTNEQDTTMGHLFSKEKDINKENDNCDGNEKVNIDIKVHIIDKDQSKNRQYFTIINDQKVPNRETMVNTRDIVQGMSNQHIKKLLLRQICLYMFSFKNHLTLHLHHLCLILHFLHSLAIQHHSLLKIV